MKRIHVIPGIICAALLIVIAVDAHYQQRQYYHPYTGGQVRQPAAYNPFTGAGVSTQQANPFTGRRSQANINPFTGQSMPQAMARNPLTGAFQPGQSAAASLAGQAAQWPKQQLPITGKAGPGLEPLDKAVITMMNRHGIPGAALAIAKDGKLAYAKGFGWADLAGGTPVQPYTIFGLASLSKPFTALAILLLIEQGKLSLDDRVVDVLKAIRPRRDAWIDPRVKKITIRQLLNHSGGWDRNKSGDPAMQSPMIARTLSVPMPITDSDFISFMWGRRLDFEPGTRMQYSNVGFIMLGKVVETVSGRPYEQFVRKHVLQRASIKSAFTNKGRRAYKANEAHRYLAGASVMLPPMNLPMVRACGGWSASAVDMVRMLTTLDGSRGKPLLHIKTFNVMLAPPPPPIGPQKDGSHAGLGWPNVSLTAKTFSYTHNGSYHGMRTIMKRSSDGVNWALLFNTSMQPDQIDDQVIRQGVLEVRQRVEAIQKYPDVDYFKEF